MANTFYSKSCQIDTKATPYADLEKVHTYKVVEGQDKNDLFFHTVNGKELKAPSSIMNEYVAVNYRNLFNGYLDFGTGESSPSFTEYSDWKRCDCLDKMYQEWQKDKHNPTYHNILKWYSDDKIDPHGLAKYKIQDFIYLKYYNQIPNNYLVTLRRYTRPCEDRMFGFDCTAEQLNAQYGNPEAFFALATAVTYMGEKPGNKLSEILKFDYGMNWEDKEAKVEALKNSDGGVAAQLGLNNVRHTERVSSDMVGGSKTMIAQRMNTTSTLQQAIRFSAMVQGKGVGISEANRRLHSYEGFEFGARYGEEFYGDVNVINKVKMRSRGLTFSNSFSLNFEYSLKSLKCVNPKVAMLDILGNFLILTGNYGSFWGGATIFYGQSSIAPQYGNPELLRNGQYGKYISSVFDDIKQGFSNLKQREDGSEGNILTAAKNLLKGAGQELLGNLLGGNIGVAGMAQAPPALLSGKPSGFWHVTVGNPLDPIAMMGNMAVTKTTVQFSDALGYDDFPTEIKFTVDLEHARPRDNSYIESMFNAGKGRIYAFVDDDKESLMHEVNPLDYFQPTQGQNNQEMNFVNTQNGGVKQSEGTHRSDNVSKIQIMGANLNP